MAETTKGRAGFNATVKSFGVTADDVATLDSVYGTRAKPIYVSHDDAIATKPRPVIVMRGVLLNCGKPDRDGDIIGDVALNDYSRAIIGPGTLQWAPLEVDEERLNQARQDLIQKFVSAGVGNLQSMRCDQSGCVVLPHDWPHESLLSSGEASQRESPFLPEELEEALKKIRSHAEPATLHTVENQQPPAPPELAPQPTYNIDSVVDFATLIPVAHAMALDKGWWEGGIASRDMNEIIANYHAEVSEAWEEYRSGRMETWTNTDGKPEGFWVEIADLLIRVADSCGARPIDFADYVEHVEDVPQFYPSTIPGLISELHGFIASDDEAKYLVPLIEIRAREHNVDIFAIVRQKLAYNATRPHRHGGKKA